VRLFSVANQILVDCARIGKNTFLNEVYILLNGDSEYFYNSRVILNEVFLPLKCYCYLKQNDPTKYDKLPEKEAVDKSIEVSSEPMLPYFIEPKQFSDFEQWCWLKNRFHTYTQSKMYKEELNGISEKIPNFNPLDFSSFLNFVQENNLTLTSDNYQSFISHIESCYEYLGYNKKDHNFLRGRAYKRGEYYLSYLEVMKSTREKRLTQTN